MTPMIAAGGATRNTSRAPTRTRENTSRPRRSVPNQCSMEGGWCPREKSSNAS